MKEVLAFGSWGGGGGLLRVWLEAGELGLGALGGFSEGV